ncbi:hypothetical protein HBE96_17220 [Clostridium sp. P21]|uniref:Uncharacterized protein n=1 Tax=Clostridium muellerianum TaxID=2716538 RepID=A0A7Y0EIZ9_9CLOT|nr:hypothetical protein [Clostridium muellerianum]NMM64363.1 hypothetical protein [Clostridium muellerianum]
MKINKNLNLITDIFYIITMVLWSTTVDFRHLKAIQIAILVITVAWVIIKIKTYLIVRKL